MNIRYLIVVLTTSCNLRCRYCYNADDHSPMEMSRAVFQQALDLAASGGGPFHLQITGGEPTLAPAMVETALSAASECDSCRGVGLQTNATRLTPRLIDLLRRHRVQVGVSLDGPPDIQERQRGMAAETLRGLQRLEAGGIAFRVTTVVTRDSAGVLDKLVLMLAGYAMARGIGLDLLVRKGRARDTGQVAAADKTTLEKGLIRMNAALRAVNAQRTTALQWREWDLIFPAGSSKKRRTAFCHAALNQSVAVMPDGRLFPCGQTCGDARFEAGTVWQPKPRMPAIILPHDRSSDTACRRCEVSAVCPGDCPSRIFYNQEQLPDLACHMYRALYRINHSIDGGIQP